MQTITLEEIYAPIEASIEKVPAALIEVLGTSNALASEVIQYFFSGKGKLLRPALTLLGAALKQPVYSAQIHPPLHGGKDSHVHAAVGGVSFSPLLGGKDSDVYAAVGGISFPPLVRLSASYEIFHAATLIHDDIIDSAYLRRNIPTINVKWGAPTAVLVGDYLHDKALEVIHTEGSREVFSLFLKTAAEVCDGEIHELSQNKNFGLTEEEYFEIIRKKTAVLLACALESGARYAGCSTEEAAALSRFGHAFGMAFQIVDDCLDFTGNEHEFGKTLGADLEAGVLTLPLIRLLACSGASVRAEIQAVFESGDAGRLRALLEKIRGAKTLDYAFEKARQFSAEARQALQPFPASPAKHSLEKLLDYVLERQR